jgi:hypothetical protein
MQTKRPLDLYHVMTNLNAGGAIDVILNTGDVVRLTLSDEYCSVISAEFLQDEVSIDFGDDDA